MLGADVEIRVPSHRPGEMDLTQHNCNLSKGESLFFFFLCQGVYFKHLRNFLSFHFCLWSFLPIVADNPPGMAKGLLKGIDGGERALCLSFYRTEQGSPFVLVFFATQPRVSFNASRAHQGRDPAQGWVTPTSVGWLQALLGWANAPFLQMKNTSYTGPKGKEQR